MTPNKNIFWHHRFNNKFDKKPEVQKYRKKTLILNYEKFNYVAINNSMCMSFYTRNKIIYWKKEKNMTFSEE